jgi:hypothetical protein
VLCSVVVSRAGCANRTARIVVETLQDVYHVFVEIDVVQPAGDKETLDGGQMVATVSARNRSDPPPPRWVSFLYPSYNSLFFSVGWVERSETHHGAE